MNNSIATIPNLFIIGVPKAGTTSIARYLQEHPDILVSKPKETCFHILEYDRGLKYYLQKYFNEYSGQQVVCDASIMNMYFSELTASKIHRDFPECKLLVILRDPVERAYSDYRSAANDGLETLSFEKAFEAENSRLKNDQWPLHVRMYFERGMYFKQIQKYLDYFDLKKIKFVIYEEFFNDPFQGILDLLKFLEVTEDFKIDVKKAYNKNEWQVRNIYLQRFLRPDHKIGTIVKKILPDSLRLRGKDKLLKLKQYNLKKTEWSRIDDKFKKHLSEYYAESNHNIEKYLGIQVSKWWKS
jgi:hypothetical protein